MGTNDVKYAPTPAIPVPVRKPVPAQVEAQHTETAGPAKTQPTDYQDSASSPGVNLTGVSKVDEQELVPARKVTICLTGAINQKTGANQEFGQMCDVLEGLQTGLIKDGKYSSFDTFPRMWAPEKIVNKVLRALDENKDGKVNSDDGKTMLTIVGFSWGAVNAARLASDVLDKVDPGPYLTTNLGLIDAFQPFVSKVKVDARISKVVNFRHSVSPEGDCSEGVPLGPYRGKRIKCAEGQECSEYDFSQQPELAKFIGHCEMPVVSKDYIISLVLFGFLMDGSLPPPAPVKRYIVP